MIRAIVCALLLFAFNFAQNFWIAGIFGFEEQKGAELKTLKEKDSFENKTPDIDGFGSLFGAYEDEGNGQDSIASKDELFVEENQAYIGKLGSYQYILYATAKLSGELSAKVLVNDLENRTVELVTVFNKQKLNQAQISQMTLSSLTMTLEQESIELRLFERSN